MRSAAHCRARVYILVTLKVSRYLSLIAIISTATLLDIIYPNDNLTLRHLKHLEMAPHNLKEFLHVRPAEIKTYHTETYDRISPTKTQCDAKGKTLFITAGGRSIFPKAVSPLLTQP